MISRGTRSGKSKDMKVKWGLLALLSTAILAAPSNSAYVDALTSEQASTSRSTLEYLAKRHGHGEHADEVSMSDVKPEVHDVSHHIPDRLDSTSSSSLASTVAATIASPSPSALKPHHNEINKATNGHANSHTHHHLHQAHIPVPLLQDKNTFIPIPPPPSGGGGHSHGGHGAESPKVELNETVIVQWRGPDPLSYLEWDFNYSIGKTEDLIRFSQAYKSSPRVRLMGVGDNRWRTLLDERDPSLRLSIASDILQRAQNDRRDPGRRRNLLLLHVVGCILSCFVLLPVGEWLLLNLSLLLTDGSLQHWRFALLNPAWHLWPQPCICSPLQHHYSSRHYTKQKHRNYTLPILIVDLDMQSFGCH